jgi:hypothetical protein
MPRGGPRPGARRPPGARNKRTVELLRAVETGGITPLDSVAAVVAVAVLVTVYAYRKIF